MSRLDRRLIRRFRATLLLVASVVALPVSSRGAEHSSASRPAGTSRSGESEVPTNPSPAAPSDALVSTNLIRPGSRNKPAAVSINYQHQIDVARQLRRSKDHLGAEKMLVALFESEIPAEFKRSALFELALVAQESGKLARAQQILAQYIQLFPQDPTLPEVLLRQGIIYRQMGANNMAVGKFYAVMNTALGLKLDQFDYYKRLVLQAQTEIADTFYAQGKFGEAADFFGRIIKQNAPELNRPQVQFKLIRCLASLGRHPEVVTQAGAYLEKYPEASEVPELRFLFASSLKHIGRTHEALAQVLKLLESQQDTLRTNPENWTYWQQRAGNEIANQLYLEGDFLNALQIYNHLAELSASAEWQLPVWYQIGLIYERLHQPRKALEQYNAILAREKEATSPGASAGVRTVIEMAKWRKEQIAWQERAEVAVQSLRLSPAIVSNTNQTLNTARP